MRLFILLLLSGISFISRAQQTLHLHITGENKAPVAASILVKATGNVITADSMGQATIHFPSNGEYSLVVTAAAYEEKEIKLTVPRSSDTLEIELESS